MKTSTLIGLVAFSTSISAFANAIVFPDSENNARTKTEIVFPKDKTPVPLVGGYQIENGILTPTLKIKRHILEKKISRLCISMAKRQKNHLGITLKTDS
jgi:long-subunit acyl-CoA synthetase (AMP-forming)